MYGANMKIVLVHFSECTHFGNGSRAEFFASNPLSKGDLFFFPRSSLIFYEINVVNIMADDSRMVIIAVVIVVIIIYLVFTNLLIGS
jgi:hypothetical protein